MKTKKPKNGGCIRNSKLALVANIEDEADGNAYEHYRFEKVGGGRGDLIIERSAAADLQRLMKALRDKNADLPRHNGAAIKLLDMVLQKSPRRFELRAAHVRGIG